MKHSLQLKLSQHLTLTPQLQQSIRLLQLSTLELNQELEQILQDNPLLERVDNLDDGETHINGSDPELRSEAPTETSSVADSSPEPEARELADIDWESEGSYGSPDDDDEDREYQQPSTETTSLRDHLVWQLNLTPLSERDKRLVLLLIDALDEGGYLSQSLQDIVEMLPPELEIELDDLQIALKHLQNLEPTGVGARNLSECLTLQLLALPADTPHRDCALTIAGTHLSELATRDYIGLKRKLHCDDDELRNARDLITHLNPKPGAGFGESDTRYIVPDVIVKKVKGLWVASLNPDAMPKLRINRMYADILSRNRDSGHQHLASQMQEAKWLIKNVMQRFETILKVSQSIIDRQRHFFEHGEVAMRPLVLREIAETVELHESTISRVTTQKFMMTPRGIYELKYFFGSHVSTETGGACSATAIRALIKQLVAAENSKKPLSDGQIADLLGQQGIVVARRTIAKYRESLQISPASQRKSL
ncbi:RNA polymerase sigma-54 factor [Sulfuriferula plumbiphila]|uniref:RNA polymerase sigma-54 factor n=1 Tax=Sulfuriferula plumbiphila TaxID=171865 RepID=A0A512L896_9PROT|nr:RNA polymerase factor sigma-54 [Sulfuriferula plumbiphila]BBP05587.1 RNA polymerase sigma-54 factor [Sulfuriferula plumbiphila]GEP30705.1 RNA polymerase sigma-54 factor [Sulfuriferula plumbiphila]